MSERNIIIVGVGALGSHLLLLSRNLPGRFTVVDFDRVERKNTLSQFHSRMGVGRNKAAAMQQAMQGLFGLRIQSVPHRLTPDNVTSLLSGADLVVDCVDNAATRQLIQEHVRAEGIPCLHGALAADGSYARIMWDEVFTIDGDGEAGQATCEDGEHLPFIAMVSARMAMAVQGFLADGARGSVHLHPGGILTV
ncbi:MAG: molybdopterin/thiamine biosynthesis adenylyltransferase [Myxococcota bacterium]|jgi:molybdopterin/thiamine biosynthesis adenylyltransferase